MRSRLAGVIGVLVVVAVALAPFSRVAAAVALVAVSGLLAYRNLTWAICLAIPAFLFLRGLDAAVPLAGALTLGLLVGGAAAGRVREAVAPWWVLVPFALLGAWTIFAWRFPGVPGAVDPATTKDVLAFLAGPLLLAIAIAARPDRRRLDTVIMLSGSGAGLCAVAASLSSIASDALGASFDADHRVTLFGLNPNFLAVSFAVGVVAAVTELSRARLPLILAALPGLVGGLVQTQSRGALLAAGVGCVVVVVAWLLDGRAARFGRSDRLVMPGVAVVGVALAIIATTGIGGGGFGRSAAQLGHDDRGRLSLSTLAYDLARQHPVRGIGIGRYPVMALADPKVHLYRATHNEYVRLAAETGFTGLALFLVTVLAVGVVPGRHDLEAVAVPVAFMATLATMNGLSTLVGAAVFWIALGARVGRSRARSLAAPA
jgi:O-antigen ligase